MKHIDFIFWDVITLQIAYMLAWGIRSGNFFPYSTLSYRNYAIVLAFVDILMAAMFNTMHNVVKRGYYQEIVQTLKQVILVFLSMSLYMFSIQSGEVYSRIALYLTAIFHLILSYLGRLAWKKLLRRWGKTTSKTTMILVADEHKVAEIVGKASRLDGFNYSGLVLTNRDAVGEEISGIKVVANLSDAADYICREWVDEVFVYPNQLSEVEAHEAPDKDNTISFFDDSYEVFSKREYSIEPKTIMVEGKLAVLIDQCRQMSIPVHIRLAIPSISGKSFIEKIGGYDVLTTTSNYASSLQMAMKRGLDILGGIVGSVIALLIMMIVGPMIKKESPGPILFKQVRIGQNGKKFKIYKLRSMYMDAEERKKELLKENRVSDGMMFKMDFDPRIIGNKIVDGKEQTGIGEFIRSNSLDEFPQFFNVLLGQMSLVGTRPPTVDEWEKYKYHHRARLAIKPGITGMWQVNGRSKITDFEEVVRLDTEYINHWSMSLDFRILLKTVKTVLNKDGAM